MFLKAFLVPSLCLVMVLCEPPAPQYGPPGYNNGGYSNGGYSGGGDANNGGYNDYNNNQDHHHHGGDSYNGHNGHNDDHGYGEPKAYEFGYQVKDDYTGTNYNRQEQSDGNQVTGSYRVALPDGRTQIVTYYADWKTGFHADVRYEGEAHYPDTHGNNNNGYNYNNNNNNGGYNSNAQNINQQYGAPVNPVAINNQYAPPSTGSGSYNTGSGYDSGYDYNNNNNYNNYDSYSGSGYSNRQKPGSAYGAP